jgi:hypothetical protein
MFLAPRTARCISRYGNMLMAATIEATR